MLIPNNQTYAIGLLAGIALLAGCSPKDNVSSGTIKSVTVRAVEHYGQVLDESTEPQKVAFVLLRAILDDALATTKEDREAAIDIQFDLAAANIIKARNKTGLTPDEYVDNVVRHWTPTIAYYASDIETEWDKAQPRLRRTIPRDLDLGAGPTTECEILVEMASPTGDPNAQVLMFVWMAKDNGFWHVIHLGFKNNVRSVEGLRELATAAQSKSRASTD